MIERDKYYNHLPINLEEYILSEEFLEPIRSTLNMEVYIQSNPPLRVKECLNTEIQYYGATNCRGAYNPKTNEIWLIDSRWCRKTLIHETLHSLSHFAYGRTTEIGGVKLFNEGLTEFFTGWVMYNHYSHCYRIWLNGLIDICESCKYRTSSLNRCMFCSLSYEQELKVIWILVENASIDDIVRLYVWEPGSNWRDIYRDFLEKYNIEDKLFVDSKLSYQNFTDRFLDALIDAFNLNDEDVIETINEDIHNLIDYSRINGQ